MHQGFCLLRGCMPAPHYRMLDHSSLRCHTMVCIIKHARHIVYQLAFRETTWCGPAMPLGGVQCAYQFFWYGINVEDPALNQPSVLERLGAIHPDSDEAARDRYVSLAMQAESGQLASEQDRLGVSHVLHNLVLGRALKATRSLRWCLACAVGKTRAAPGRADAWRLLYNLV